MTTSTLNSSRSLSRRIAASTAALGLAFSLAACGSDDDADGDAASSSGVSASESGAAGADGKGGADAGSGDKNGEQGKGKDGHKDGDKGGDKGADDKGGDKGADGKGGDGSGGPAAAGERPAGAPSQPIDQLLLTGGEAGEFGLTPVPASDIADSVKAMSGIAEGAQVNPPECADFNANAMAAQTAPGTTALATGQAAGAPVSLAVTTVTSELSKQVDLVKRCPEMDITLPMQGGELKNHSSNRTFDTPAPQGVDNFSAIEQESTVTMAGQTQTAHVVSINGVVRGIGVTVVTQNPNGPVSPEAKQAAVDLFNKQAEKIKNS